ncbi:MAG TPA: hypothetical protein VFI78_01705, partial [Salinimicrobium sp.]|nr:hypothetical protein [Salinimicrobium sp.]
EVIFKDNLEEIFGKRPYQSRDEMMNEESKGKEVPVREETVTEKEVIGSSSESETPNNLEPSDKK